MSTEEEDRQERERMQRVKDFKTIPAFDPIAFAEVMKSVAASRLIEYRAYRHAGFTEDEAIKLVKAGF